MKNILITLLVLLVVGLSTVQAQKIANVDMGAAQHYAEYTPTSAVTIAGTTEWTKTFYINKPGRYYYDVTVQADSAGSGVGVNFYLRYSINGVTFYELDTIPWACSSADTSILFTSKVSVLGDTTKIDPITARMLQIGIVGDNDTVIVSLPKSIAAIGVKVSDE